MNKNIWTSAVVAAVVAVIVAAVFGGKIKTVVQETANLAGVKTVVDEYPNGIKIGAKTYNTVLSRMELDQGINQIAFKNNSGEKRIVTNVTAILHASTTARVNSSFHIDGATSSAATIINYNVDYAQPTTTPLAFFPSVAIGTSTPVRNILPLSHDLFAFASTSNDILDGNAHSDRNPYFRYADITNYMRYGFNQNVSSRFDVEWLDGENIVFAVSPLFYDNRCGGTAAGICKTATSTLLGIDDIDFIIEYYEY